MPLTPNIDSENLSLRKPLAILFSVAFAGALSTLFYMQQRLTSHSITKVFLPGTPSSVDPIAYDSWTHHVAFRSVLAGLVSDYRTGAFTGIIAQSWTISDDRLEWRFHFRNNIRFENGEAIVPTHVVKAWTRLAFLMNQKKSRSDLFSNIQGMEQVRSPNQVVPGLIANNEDLILRLKNPAPRLLEILSSGIYSVPHPSDYDSTSGEWKNQRRVVASGAYQISSWKKKEITLNLRNEGFPPNLHHPTAVKEIKITWADDGQKDAQIIVADSNALKVEQNMQFHGTTPSGIGFVRCFNWSLPNSVCSSIEQRKALRALFHQILRNAGSHASTSFFPLAMDGVSEIGDSIEFGDHEKSIVSKMKSLRIFFRRKSGNAYFDILRERLPTALRALGVQMTEIDLSNEEMFDAFKPNLKKYPTDLGIFVTGVLVEDPTADIRFMFQSKEGVSLPDIDQSVAIELQNPHFSVQKINEHIWKQAVIFPLGHFAPGVWAEPKIDFSQLNTTLPPTDFSWIGER